MGKTTKLDSKSKVNKTNLQSTKNSIEDKTTFFYYAFRNVLLVSLPLTIISTLLLSLPHSFADSSSSDNISIELPVSCTMSGVGNTHSESLINGTYDNNIGNGVTTLTTYCNDKDGYIIYAIGNGNNEESNTNLVGNNGSNIATGTATSGNTSNWAMKLASLDNTLTMNSTYTSDFASIPASWTEVAKKESNTTDSETGSSITTTYAVYVSNFQAAGTYSGQVKYAMFHPSSALAPTSIEGALAANHKEKYNGYYKMQDMNPTICNMVNIYGEASQTQLIDVRDNNVYWVAKLNDNNCWMTQNLDLDLSHEVALTSETSDIDPTTYNTGIYTEAAGYNQSGNVVSWTPSTIDSNNIQRADTILANGNTASGWTDDNNHPYSADSGNKYRYTNPTSYSENEYNSLENCAMNNNDDIKGCEHGHYGNYYNWPAAAATNNASTAPNGSTWGNSICPKNWDLPANGKYGTMLTPQGVYDNGSYTTDGFNKIRTAPLYFARFGLVSGGTLQSGSGGYYWSSTINSNAKSYYLALASSNIYPSNSGNRSYGFPVRCIVSSS